MLVDLVMTLTLALAPAAAPPWPRPDDPATKPIDVVAALETAVADAIARVERSVVAIARDKNERGDVTTAVKGRTEELPGEFNIDQPEYISFDYGSGVVIGDQGQILTAFHVVRGASKILVRAAGRQQFAAEVIAADPRSDLAVIVPRDRPDTPRPRLTPVPLGDATRLRKGSFLVALGNPFNAARDGRASASLGILANFARKVEQTSRDSLQLRNLPSLLQLDAKLNLGMSGGAVVNLRGELVGLTTGAANSSGFDAQAGYAIPVDALGRRVIETLRQGREVEYGLIGIRANEEKTNVVNDIQVGTPASDAGLMIGDVMTEVGGLPVADFDDLVMAVNTLPPGRPLSLTIRRNGASLVKSITLAKYPIQGEVIATNRPAPWRGLRVDYLSMLPDNQVFGRARLDAMTRGGVGIVEVVPGSPADAAGLRVGEVVVTVDGTPVKIPADFALAVAAKDGPIELRTESDRTVTIK